MNHSNQFSVMWILSSFVTAVCLLAPPVRAESPDELRLDHFLDLRRPDVAKQLVLSDDQSIQVGTAFQELTDQVTVIYRKYPRGGQDNEGEAIRQRCRTDFLLALTRTRERLEKLLTPLQLEELRRRTPSVTPPREMVWELDHQSPISPTSRLSRRGVGDLGFTTEQFSAYYGSKYPSVQRIWDDVPTLPGSSFEREAAVLKRIAAREQAIRSLLTLEQLRLLDKLEQRDAQRPQPRFHVLELSASRENDESNPKVTNQSPREGYELTQLASLVQLKQNKAEAATEIVVGHPAVYVIRSRAFSHDGRLMASAAVTLSPAFQKERVRYPRSEIRVWDTKTGELLAMLTSPSEVAAVEFVHSSVLLVRPASGGRLGN